MAQLGAGWDGKDMPPTAFSSGSNGDDACIQNIQSISHDIQFILEGVIGGLSSGQIALHESGNLLKRCNGASPDPDENYPITLKIINTCTNETIAIFNMFWES